MIISCSDVNNARERNSVFKKCVSTTYGHVWISHTMACELVLQRRPTCCTLIERNDAWFMNRIGILRGVYVFNSMTFFQAAV